MTERYLIYRWFDDIRSAPIVSEMKHHYVIKPGPFPRDEALAVVHSAQTAQRILEAVKPIDEAYRADRRAKDAERTREAQEARAKRDATVMEIINAQS